MDNFINTEIDNYKIEFYNKYIEKFNPELKNIKYYTKKHSDNNCNTASSKDYSMIDHVLVTDKIRKNIINTFVYHAYDEFCGKYDSDHYPVIIDLIF
jgi:exonuclease III